MHGICFEYELQDWFDFKIPKTKISKDFIFQALEVSDNFTTKPNAKIVWLGGNPAVEYFTKSKKGNSWEMSRLTFHHKKESFTIQMNKDEGEWLLGILKKIAVSNTKAYTFQEIKSDFEKDLEDFELFFYSKPIKTLREFGLLIL
jgi:hypothetical protein